MAKGRLVCMEGLKMTIETPLEALIEIKRACAAGEISIGSDTLARAFDPEIQEIFVTIYTEYGRTPRRPFWTADGQPLGVILDVTTDRSDYTPESYEACRRAGARLGIPLDPKMVWEEAGAALRTQRARDKS